MHNSRSEAPSATSIAQAKAELERLSSIGIATINRRDWTYTSPEAQEFLGHLDPHFKSKFDGHSYPLTWIEQNAVWKELVLQQPEAHFGIIHISSDVREKDGTATVWVQSKVVGIDQVHMTGLSELKWRLVDGKWMFYHHVGMRGFAGQTGFV